MDTIAAVACGLGVFAGFVLMTSAWLSGLLYTVENRPVFRRSRRALVMVVGFLTFIICLASGLGHGPIVMLATVFAVTATIVVIGWILIDPLSEAWHHVLDTHT